MIAILQVDEILYINPDQTTIEVVNDCLKRCMDLLIDKNVGTIYLYSDFLSQITWLMCIALNLPPLAFAALVN